MHHIYESLITAMANNEPAVLATLVKTRGSAPQKPGAKMLVLQDGQAVGTLGGGCVEGDIWHYAKEILREGGGPQFREYRLNEEMAARDGLVCGGTMYFFLEPLSDVAVVTSLAEEILGAEQGERALVTVTAISSTREGVHPGDRLVVYEDGAQSGVLAASSLEPALRNLAQDILERGGIELHVLEDGTEVLAEAFKSPPTLILMGGGHVAHAVAELAFQVGFQIVVIDDREAFSRADRFPQAKTCITADFVEGLKGYPVHRNCYILIATRGHRYDDLALEAAIKTPASYIGMLGSKRKVILIYRRFHEKGIPLSRMAAVHAPVGMDIGAVTPRELAVSIVAELIAARYHRRGGPIKLTATELERMLGAKA